MAKITAIIEITFLLLIYGSKITTPKIIGTDQNNGWYTSAWCRLPLKNENQARVIPHPGQSIPNIRLYTHPTSEIRIINSIPAISNNRFNHSWLLKNSVILFIIPLY